MLDLKAMCGAVMHDDNLSYAESFEEVLEGLFEGERLQSSVKVIEQRDADRGSSS